MRTLLLCFLSVFLFSVSSFGESHVGQFQIAATRYVPDGNTENGYLPIEGLISHDRLSPLVRFIVPAFVGVAVAAANGQGWGSYLTNIAIGYGLSHGVDFLVSAQSPIFEPDAKEADELQRYWPNSKFYSAVLMGAPIYWHDRQVSPRRVVWIDNGGDDFLGVEIVDFQTQENLGLKPISELTLGKTGDWIERCEDALLKFRTFFRPENF